MEPNPVNLLPARVVELPAFEVVGICRRYDEQTSGQIPQQWQAFNQLEWFGPSMDTTYGVCFNSDGAGQMDYLTGVELVDPDLVDPNADRITVSPQTYAVFHHPGHVSEMRWVWQAIWSGGLAQAKLTATPGMDFEKHGPTFDGQTGAGGYEVWVSIEAP